MQPELPEGERADSDRQREEGPDGAHFRADDTDAPSVSHLAVPGRSGSDGNAGVQHWEVREGSVSRDFLGNQRQGCAREVGEGSGGCGGGRWKGGGRVHRWIELQAQDHEDPEERQEQEEVRNRR